MSWNGWDTLPNGDIAVFPVTGWATATFMKGMSGGLRLEFSTEPTMKNQAAVQLVLTNPQVHELIGALQKLAGNLDAALAADKPMSKPS